jgi:hypothetical protein
MSATGTACVKTQELTLFAEDGKISRERKLPDLCGCCLIRLLSARMWKHPVHSGEREGTNNIGILSTVYF